MPFLYLRTVRLSDTDAAGVVYFANVLHICHEAYEEALIEAGIKLKDFVDNPSTAIPIVHGAVDFFRPMFCGDRLLIELVPHQLSKYEFQLIYQVSAAYEPDNQLARANTKHVCINPSSRNRTVLPESIIEWLNK